MTGGTSAGQALSSLVSAGEYGIASMRLDRSSICVTRQQDARAELRCLMQEGQGLYQLCIRFSPV